MRPPTTLRWLVTSLAAGCGVREAPEDLDSLLRSLWATAADAPAPLVHRDLSLVGDVIDLDDLGDGEIRGSQGALSAEAIAGLTFTTADDQPRTPDLSRATGIHLIDQLPCTEDALLDVLLSPDQGVLYGTYESYRRTFDDDPADFRDGLVDRTSWSGRIETFIPFPVGATYLYAFRAEIRRVDTPDGTVYFTRTWMPSPATWDKEGPQFDQDYQLEAWIPTRDGQAHLHLYPVWRQMRAGGFDMTNEGMQFITLDQMTKWDARTTELCAKGLHPAD